MNCTTCGETIAPGARFCGECGAAVAPSPFAPPPGPPTAEATLLPDPPRPRFARRVLGLVISALVIGGVAAVAFGAVQSGAGASTPEDAVKALAGRLADEDVLGVIATLAPDEVRSLEDAYRAALDSAEDEQLLGDGDDPLQGIDLRIDGLELEAQELSDDVARVHLRGGTFGIRVDPAELTPKLRELAQEENGGEAVDESVTVSRIEKLIAESSGGGSDGSGLIDGVYVMTVKRDGGWYVSPAYTVAQMVTEQAGLPTPDFSTSRPHKGSASPEDALRDMVGDAGRLDVESVLDRLPPGELAVLQDYREVIFTPDVRESIAGAAESFHLELSTLETTTSALGGGLTRVDVERVAGSLRAKTESFACEALGSIGSFGSFGSVEGLDSLDSEAGSLESFEMPDSAGSPRPPGTRGSFEQFEFEVGGDPPQLAEPTCNDTVTELTADFDITGTCAKIDSQEVQRGEDGAVLDSSADHTDECLDPTAAGHLREITGLDGIAVVVKEVDGSWYVSPVETILYLVDRVTENTDAVEDLVNEMGFGVS